MKFKEPRLRHFFETYGIETFAVNEDESQLVYSTNINGHYNVWALDLPNQYPYPLTFHNQTNRGVTFSKDGSFILILTDRDGDENDQIYATPSTGGELQPLRTHEGKKHIGPLFSEDGNTLYYTSNKEDPTYMKVYAFNVKDGEETIILHGSDAPTYLLDKSKEEPNYLIMKHFSNTHVIGYVFSNNELVSMTPDPESQHVVAGGTFISEDEVYFTTNYQADRTYLAKYNVRSQTFEKVIEVDDTDFTHITYDNTNHILYIVGSHGVNDSLFTYSVETDEMSIIELPIRVIDQLHVAKSGAVYILGDTSTATQNIYRLSEDGWKPLTSHRVPTVKEEHLSTPEVVQYQSFDGTTIEALLFKPVQSKDNGRVVFWPHGGPQAAERDSFRSLFQAIVYEGYTLFAPNFRGSSGYGQEFMQLVEGDWGHGPRLDNVYGLEWLIQQGYATKGEIFLLGGSYGGYMALLLHGRHQDYFKAVVDIFGPSNLFSFIESVPPHWKPIMAKWVGDPIQDKEKLIEDSPITYLDGMTKPMYVIQGANDPRVVKQESDQIVEALRNKGRKIEYLVLEDEGHGFSKKANEIRVYEEVLRFFRDHLTN
ncbi:peptidase S9 [Pontibacillus halophilus JSM 076056 = DSM 19796]|uniref:Peptidase S9 n=1 Tax=Pontibacillus halophilus JSM 076056 = DSM 19796 TaxID=1385510 RepID=A0A0A5GFD3_9BACI|nr:S9 family peptidase [Pontibacillus halophilus]KGX91926.1 peptidase S9 [Pontibacillus halophilus JSM 076056 = DSM 19796]